MYLYQNYIILYYIHIKDQFWTKRIFGVVKPHAVLCFRLYLWLNLGHLKGEVNACCGTRDRFPTCGYAPSNPIPVPNIKLMVLLSKIIHTGQPTVLEVPGLKEREIDNKMLWTRTSPYIVLT